MSVNLPKAVVWDGNKLFLLDQTLLPHQEVVLECDTVESVFHAIQELKVRGAPAIGIAAAFGLLLEESDQISLNSLVKKAEYLKSARPTAVNLAWAVDRMVSQARNLMGNNVDSEGIANNPSVAIRLLHEEATKIFDEDKKSCLAIGDHGLSLLTQDAFRKKLRLLTHCNAGSLAVSEYGTALAPIYRAHEQGIEVHVFVDETRPLLQGSRLTSYELSRHGVDHTLITDSMAAHVISSGEVDAVIVGADRVAKNGDVANKIGTLSLAIICQHYAVPFYVACPLSTIDLLTSSGEQIEIESRHPDEVRSFLNAQSSLPDVNVYNPAFDVTPANLVSALITEQGVIFSPDETKLLDHCRP